MTFGREKIKFGSDCLIYSAIFDGKIPTAFEVSFSACFQIMGSFISLMEESSSSLNCFIGSAFPCFLRIFCQRQLFLFFVENSKLLYNPALNSPKFENLLQGKAFFSIFGWRFMLKSIRDSKYCLRDHVNYHSNFCFEINWINNFKLKILICLFLKHCMKHQVLMFFPCFLRKVKEINSSDVNCVS